MDLKIEINDAKLRQALRCVPGYLREELSDAIDHGARKFFKTFWQTRLQGPPGIRARHGGIFIHFFRRTVGSGEVVSPSAKSSVSKASIFNSAARTSNLGVVIFSDSKIARLHEFGGTVTAGSGKLAVPLSINKEMYTASGQLRKRFREPGQLKNVEPVKIKGKTYLAKITRRTREIKPLYVLKRSIRLKPRLQFYQTWEKLEPLRMQYINKAISKALKRA